MGNRLQLRAMNRCSYCARRFVGTEATCLGCGAPPPDLVRGVIFTTSDALSDKEAEAIRRSWEERLSNPRFILNTEWR
jgi:hypothetical protein